MFEQSQHCVGAMYPWKEGFLMKTYKIYVDCANCAAKMEEAVRKTEGIADATVNFMALKMNVEFEEGADEKNLQIAMKRREEKAKEKRKNRSI